MNPRWSPPRPLVRDKMISRSTHIPLIFDTDLFFVGDFEEWGFSDFGVKLDLALKKVRSEAGNDKQAYEQIMPELEEFMVGLEQRPELWKDELDELQEQFSKVCNDEIVTTTLLDTKTKFRHASGKVGTIGVMIHPPGEAEVSVSPLAPRPYSI